MDNADMAMFKQVTPEMREALENVEFPCDADACHKLMFTLEADYHQGGWDQPHIMYLIVGDPADPYFVRNQIPVLNHPAAHLQALWDHGVRLRDEVHGIAFATETWQHLTFDDVQERNPDMVAGITAGIRQSFPDLNEEEARDAAEKAYYAAVEQFFPMPSEMPDELRMEGRNIVLTFRNGTTLGISRIRDKEPVQVDPLPWSLVNENGPHNRVPKFIHQMLNNQRPEMTPGENLWNEGHH